MKTQKFTWLFGIPVLAAMLFFTACKDPNSTGFGVLPPDDFITAEYLDTFDIHLQTLPVDSVYTQLAQQQLFGTYVDPEFGRLKSGFFTEFAIISQTTFNTEGGSLTLDSLVLSLDVFDSYGKWEDEQVVHIHPLTEIIPEDSLYSNDTIAYDINTDYANGYTTTYGDIGGITTMEIRLDDALGNLLLFADPGTYYEDLTTFRDLFKGLYVTAEPTSLGSREPGAAFYVDLASSVSKMTLYYKEDTTAKAYDFQIVAATRRFHHVQRSETADKLYGMTLALNEDDPQYNFIQAGGLTTLFVNFPTIESLEPVGINRAILELKVDPNFYGSNDRFEPPSSIFAYRAEEDTTANTIGEPFSQGDFDAECGCYQVRLTNYVMQVVNQKIDNNGLILVPSSRWFTMNRAIIGGTGNPNLAPVLKVTYTTMPGIN